MNDPDNLVLVHLRELRADIQKLDRRLDAMHRNGMTALKSFIGHRAMTERAFGSLDDDFKKLKARLDSLESAAT